MLITDDPVRDAENYYSRQEEQLNKQPKIKEREGKENEFIFL